MSAFVVGTLSFALLGAISSDDKPYARRLSSATGDAEADELIGATLQQDDQKIRDLWNALGQVPCVPPTEIGLPKCLDDEAPGTPVRGSATKCDAGEVRLDDLNLGVPEEWDLYSVELLDSRRGRLYRAVFSKRGAADERAVVLEFRTPGDALRGIVSTAFMTYAESCDTAGAVTAGAQSFVVPPPERGDR